MSAEGPRSALTGAGWTAILVHQGLARFAADLLPGDAALVQAVADEAPPPAEAPDHRDWEGLLDALADAWPDDRNEGPLGRLVDELGIGPPGLFLLGLAGACEESHLVGLLLDRLQSPETGARPRVHLVLAMARELFGVSALDVHWLLSLPTLASGLFTLEGEGPLPTRVLRVHPILWSVLNGRPVRWPGCRVVLAGDRKRLLPAAIIGDIPALADLLRRGHARSLVIRGPPGGGKGILAAEIGRAAGLTPLEVPVDLWKAGACAAACLPPRRLAAPAATATGARGALRVAGRRGGLSRGLAAGRGRGGRRRGSDRDSAAPARRVRAPGPLAA